MSAGAATGIRWSRVPLLGLGIAALVCAVFGGLVRLPVNLPLVRADWVLLHGPLMVCAFLGTVISLERAVGLPDRWPYAATILLGAAGGDHGGQGDCKENSAEPVGGEHDLT